MALYIIRQQDTGYVKIGRSENPFQRLLQLQTGSPTQLDLLCAIDMPEVGESDLHKFVWKYRREGEWFIADRQFYQTLWQSVALHLAGKQVVERAKRFLASNVEPLFDWAGDDFPNVIKIPGKRCRNIALRDATVSELQAAIDLLNSEGDPIIRNRNRLQEVLDICLASGGQQNDLIIELLSPDAAA